MTETDTKFNVECPFCGTKPLLCGIDYNEHTSMMILHCLKCKKVVSIYKDTAYGKQKFAIEETKNIITQHQYKD